MSFNKLKKVLYIHIILNTTIIRIGVEPPVYIFGNSYSHASFIANLSANCFLQLSQRMPAEYARLDIIINISSERVSPFSTRVSNNSKAEKAVFTIFPSVHLSQTQLHTDDCCVDCKDCFTKQSLQIVACLSLVLSSISN
jgi:hypothetical protein